MAKKLDSYTKAELIELVAQLAKQVEAQPKPKQPELVKPCPEYATAAQRIEYDKLAEHAKKLHKGICKAAGTETVSVFIPVPKKQDQMPHSISFKATYSK